MLAWSEIGPALLAKSDDGYNVLVGSTGLHPLLFNNYSKHPNIYNKDTNSHAAGRYQFMPATWNGLGMFDFAPANQDLGAIKLILRRKALHDVQSGWIESAIYSCREEWASLPGNTYGQPTHKLDNLMAAFYRALNVYKVDFSNVQAGSASVATEVAK